jgi:ABC-2 type transport system ATP-binding protein
MGGMIEMETIQMKEPASAAPSVSLRGLRKTFRTPAGPLEAVRGVDLVVAPGETVALLGANGAGKSTTIDLMLGLQQADAGTAELFEGSPAAAVAAGRIGVMLQTGGLLRDLSVRELMTMMAALTPHPIPVEDALALAGVQRLADRRTERLSGGETQRVRFALAVLGDPDLLVFDEPTAGMDVEGRHRFWTAARGLSASGRTVLFATHYLEEADVYADRVVLLARGRVIADRPPGELRALVGGRTITATLAGVAPEQLERLPGVTRAERRGDSVVLSCADSDAAVRALLATYPEVSNLEIRGAALEDAFLELTADGREEER